MFNIIKDKKGVTLIEVVIATAIIVILFSMFAMIITGVYKVNTSLDTAKSGRERQAANVENKVGANIGSATQTGSMKLTLDFSDIDASYSDAEKNCGVYISGSYGDSNGYIYAYTYSGEATS